MTVYRLRESVLRCMVLQDVNIKHKKTAIHFNEVLTGGPTHINIIAIIHHVNGNMNLGY